MSFRLIIAGSRSLHDYNLIQKAINYSGWQDKITEVVSGTAPGIDSLAITWANKQGISVKRMPAQWDKIDNLPAHQIKIGKTGKPYNVRAGYDRNRAMAEYVGKKGGLLAIYDGESGGTANMIEVAQELGLKVCVYEL